MAYPPQLLKFFKVKKKKTALGGYEPLREPRVELRGYLDMTTADDDQGIQKAHIEVSKFVCVILPWDNGGSFPIVPQKGDILTDARGRDYVVTFADDPVGIQHHLEVLCDYLPNGVA